MLNISLTNKKIKKEQYDMVCHIEYNQQLNYSLLVHFNSFELDNADNENDDIIDDLVELLKDSDYDTDFWSKNKMTLYLNSKDKNIKNIYDFFTRYDFDVDIEIVNKYDDKDKIEYFIKFTTIYECIEFYDKLNSHFNHLNKFNNIEKFSLSSHNKSIFLSLKTFDLNVFNIIDSYYNVSSLYENSYDMKLYYDKYDTEILISGYRENIDGSYDDVSDWYKNQIIKYEVLENIDFLMIPIDKSEMRLYLNGNDIGGEFYGYLDYIDSKINNKNDL